MGETLIQLKEKGYALGIGFVALFAAAVCA
jgi:hypothetical protein